MFHQSFYDAPRTGINLFAIESFDLSARVGESLANCLSIQASRQVVKIMLFSVLIGINRWFKWWNDLYPQKRCFIEVFIFRHAPEDRLLYCRLKRRAARSVVKILMASLVLFSINRWFQQWNDLHLQNNVLSAYLWCTQNLTAVKLVDKRRLVFFVSAVFRSVTTRCEMVLFEARWRQWLKQTVKCSDGSPTTSFSGYVVWREFIAIKLL